MLPSGSIYPCTELSRLELSGFEFSGFYICFEYCVRLFVRFLCSNQCRSGQCCSEWGLKRCDRVVPFSNQCRSEQSCSEWGVKRFDRAFSNQCLSEQSCSEWRVKRFDRVVSSESGLVCRPSRPRRFSTFLDSTRHFSALLDFSQVFESQWLRSEPE